MSEFGPWRHPNGLILANSSPRIVGSVGNFGARKGLGPRYLPMVKIRMVNLKTVGAIAASAAVLTAVAGCSTSSSDSSGGRANANAAAASSGTVEFCNWFPSGSLPPNPSPAPTPYGPPSDPTSLQKLRDAVSAKFLTLPKKGQYCASGQTNQQGPIDPALCNKLYTGFQYTNDPKSLQQMCNFWYARADNSMWTELTPMVLNQYGDYLGIQSDGRNIPNLAAGPHITITSIDGTPANFGSASAPFGQVTINNGKLDAASLTSLVNSVGTSTAGTFSSSYNSSLMPIIAGSTLRSDCSEIITSTSSTPVALSTITPAAKTSFWCPMVGDSPQTGVAYAQVQVTAVTPAAASVMITVPEAGTTSSLLRKPGSPSYDASNLVMPIGTDEVSKFQTLDLVPSATCTNGNPKVVGPNQCLHVWLTKVKQGQSCTIWFVYEVDKTAIANTMSKYQLDPSSLTAHISLGNNPSANWTQCSNAQALNTASGTAKDGNPPKAFLEQPARVN